MELTCHILDQTFVISEVVKSLSTKISIKMMQLTNPDLQYPFEFTLKKMEKRLREKVLKMRE
jgi:hypothetical protein